MGEMLYISCSQLKIVTTKYDYFGAPLALTDVQDVQTIIYYHF